MIKKFSAFRSKSSFLSAALGAFIASTLVASCLAPVQASDAVAVTVTPQPTPIRYLPLQVTIQEVPLRKWGTVDQRRWRPPVLFYGSDLKAVVKGPFRKSTEPYDKHGNFVEGPLCKWSLLSFQQKSANGTWQDQPVEPLEFPESFNVLPEHIGEWRFKVQVDVECFNDYGSVWQGSATREITLRITKDTIVRHNLAYRKAGKGQSYSRQPVELTPEVAYISHIEWQAIPNYKARKLREDMWRPVPQKGDPGYPLIVESRTELHLRAVRRDLKSPWPNYPTLYPVWRETGFNTGYYPRGDIYQPRLSAEGNNSADSPLFKDFEVSVECGNQATVMVRKMADASSYPPPSIGLEFPRLHNSSSLQIAKNSGTKMVVRIPGPIYGAADVFRVRLRASYGDGTSAGTIANSTYPGPVFYIRRGDYATGSEVEFTAGDKIGKATLVAEVLDDQDKVIKSSEPVTVSIVEP